MLGRCESKMRIVREMLLVEAGPKLVQKTFIFSEALNKAEMRKEKIHGQLHNFAKTGYLDLR